MLERSARVLSNWSTRWVPDAFVIAVLLTGVVFALCLLFTPSTPFQVVAYWGDGLWTLLEFAMQMCLVMMTGFIFASSVPVRKFLDWLSSLPRSPKGVITVMSFSSMTFALIHWGLSLAACSYLVRRLSRTKTVHYPLLVAAAYMGPATTWHAGLSASAPLLVATPKHFMEQDMGVVPLAQTIFHPFNIILVIVVLLLFTPILSRMHPGRKEDQMLVSPEQIPDEAFEPPRKPSSLTPGLSLEFLPYINLFLAGMGGVYLFHYFFHQKGTVTLNSLNLSFLTLGVLFHWTPASFLKAAQEGGTFIWSIVIQFPLYAGIFGMIKFSGLSNEIAKFFASVFSHRTYPLFVCWYSGLLNYFIPSGGSKWAVEAPYVVSAAKALHVPVPLTVLSYAWGDMLSDAIQPFWATPLLTVARLEFRHIMGYLILVFLPYAALVTAAFLIAPMLF